MGANQGNVDPDAVSRTILSELERQSRQPFVDELAKALSHGPSGTDYRKLAADDPEKWSRAVFSLARLAGYTNQTEHVHRHLVEDTHQLLLELHKAFGEQAALKAAKELGMTEAKALQILRQVPVTVDGELEAAELLTYDEGEAEEAQADEDRTTVPLRKPGESTQ